MILAPFNGGLDKWDNVRSTTGGWRSFLSSIGSTRKSGWFVFLKPALSLALCIPIVQLSHSSSSSTKGLPSFPGLPHFPGLLTSHRISNPTLVIITVTLIILLLTRRYDRLKHSLWDIRKGMD